MTVHDPAEPPADVVHAIAAQIHDCCGHTLLKSFRFARGWTVREAIRELGEACAQFPRRGVTERLWRKWEAGDPADRDYQDRLSRLFQANPVLLGFAADYSPTQLPRTSLATNLWVAELFDGYAEGADDVTFEVVTAQGVIIVRLSRRVFASLVAGGGLATLIPTFPATVEASGHASHPWPPGEDPVAYFTRILTGHQDGHHLLAPGDHIALLNQRLNIIDNVRQAADLALRAQLRTVQTAYAEHISWLHKEAGNQAACLRWADRAAQWGLEAGDYPMVGYLLLRKASLALDAGDHTTALELAQATQRCPWTVPAVLRAAAHIYQARARAAGDSHEFAEAHFHEADELLAASSHEPRPAYLRFYDDGFGQLQRATCLVDACRPREAVTILRERIISLPPTRLRDKAVCEARLALAHAADSGLRSLAIAQDTGSQHTRAELARLDRTLMTRWAKQPKVRELHDALTA